MFFLSSSKEVFNSLIINNFSLNINKKVEFIAYFNHVFLRFFCLVICNRLCWIRKCKKKLIVLILFEKNRVFRNSRKLRYLLTFYFKINNFSLDVNKKLFITNDFFFDPRIFIFWKKFVYFYWFFIYIKWNLQIFFSLFILNDKLFMITIDPIGKYVTFDEKGKINSMKSCRNSFIRYIGGNLLKFYLNYYLYILNDRTLAYSLFFIKVIKKRIKSQ